MFRYNHTYMHHARSKPKFQHPHLPRLAMTAARNERDSRVPAPSDAAKKNGSPIPGSRFCDARYENLYCVDRSICVMLIVLTLRSMGVCGGSKFGVKNCVSKLY